MKRLLLLSSLAACFALQSARADLHTLAQLDPTTQPPGPLLAAAPYAGEALGLPTVVAVGAGNRIEFAEAEGGDGGRVLIVEKTPGTDRASFGFGWPAGTLPPSGVFTLRTLMRAGSQAGESGNFTMSVRTGGEPLVTLQVGRTGVLDLIRGDGEPPLRAGRLRAEGGGFEKVTLELDYARHELRLAVGDDSAVMAFPFEGDQPPTSVIFATSTVRETARRLEFREIAITHELGR